jgi:hypothetical protein
MEMTTQRVQISDDPGKQTITLLHLEVTVVTNIYAIRLPNTNHASNEPTSKGQLRVIINLSFNRKFLVIETSNTNG